MKKTNVIKTFGELLIIILGISIALIGEQWREDREEERDLLENLESVRLSLADDSIALVQSSYNEFDFVIGQIDSAILILEGYPKIDLTQNLLVFENSLIQPLMDITNYNLSAFINSKILNYLDDRELRRNLFSYDYMTRDDWDKDKRELDYIVLQIRPNIYSFINLNGQSPVIDMSIFANNKIRLINDLNYLRRYYNNKRDRRFPYLLGKSSKIRYQIRIYNGLK